MTNTATTEEMRQEAIRRMDTLVKLGMSTEPRKRLKLGKTNPTLYYSLQTPIGGILYFVDNEGEEAQTVKGAMEELEELGHYPYHAVVTNTQFGLMTTVLYVSKHKEDWNETPFEEGYEFAYAGIDLYEFGMCGFTVQGGGLIRTV